MKHLRVATILLLLVSNIFSCKKGEKKIEFEALETFINKNLEYDASTKWIVILPGLGCHGCIQEAEIFMKDYIENQDIRFVLTKIESLKILENKINVHLKGRKNVYLDTKSELVIPTDNSIYPCVVQVENGKLINHEFQAPNNLQALERIKFSVDQIIEK